MTAYFYRDYWFAFGKWIFITMSFWLANFFVCILIKMKDIWKLKSIVNSKFALKKKTREIDELTNAELDTKMYTILRPILKLDPPHTT